MKNIKGNKYSRLLVISENEVRKDNKVQWNCVCDCGKKLVVCGKALRTGNTKSCGCLQKEKASVSIKNFLQNNECPNIIHGMARTRIYNTWKNMNRRCKKKGSAHYKLYGGRGIKVCEEWNSFEKFYEDMKDGYTDDLTIDRIDVNGNYCKENCRWITMKEQSNNRRSNHILEFNGEKLNIEQWAKKLGIPRNRLQNRINRGWNLELALTNKIYPGNNNHGYKKRI